MSLACPQCQQPVQPSWNLCPHCGTALAAAQVGQAVEQALRADRARAARRRRRGRAEETTPLGMFLGGVAGYVFLAVFFPPLATTWLGWIVLAGAGLGAIFYLVEAGVERRSVARSLVALVLWGAVVVALIGGTSWYFARYLPTQGGAAFFGRPRATPSPTLAPLPSPEPTVDVGPYG